MPTLTQSFDKEVFLRQLALMTPIETSTMCESLYDEILLLRGQLRQTAIAPANVKLFPVPQNQPNSPVKYAYALGDEVIVNGTIGKVSLLLSPQRGVPYYRVQLGKTTMVAIVVAQDEITSIGEYDG